MTERQQGGCLDEARAAAGMRGCVGWMGLLVRCAQSIMHEHDMKWLPLA
jgi:hypothetical protein